jgi:hypothetical protein
LKIRIALFLGELAFAAAAPLGQVPQLSSMSSSHVPNGDVTITVTFTPERYLALAITGAPNPGEQVSEHTQTLNDGTRVSKAAGLILKIYRDSAVRPGTLPGFVSLNLEITGIIREASKCADNKMDLTFLGDSSIISRIAKREEPETNPNGVGSITSRGEQRELLGILPLDILLIIKSLMEWSPVKVCNIPSFHTNKQSI